MDTRKIIEFGKSSYIITLPKSWLINNNLKKGDSLFVTKNANDLIFSMSELRTSQKPITTTISIDGKTIQQIEAEIKNAYLTYSDSIEVISKNIKANATQIKNILRNLAGMEILEQTSTKVVAKNLISIDEISIPTLIRRMDTLTRGMIEDGQKCFEEDHYESIRSRDWDVNRLFYLSSRVIRAALKDYGISQRLNTNPLELQHNHLMILRLEKTADRQKRIARECKNLVFPRKLKDNIKKIYSDIGDRYNDVMKAYYTKNKDLALKVEITNKDRIEMLNKLQDKHHDPRCTRIIENLKATTSEIRSMAKTVMVME